jgi:hypothetical protein
VTMPGNVLLSGVVGSVAYGLAGPDSDIDRLGVFAHDTVELLGLARPNPTYHSTSPDVTLHEALKFCQLSLAGNPTVMELLWLPEYEKATALGFALVGIRQAFPSAWRCRNAYLGYATQQLRKLQARGDGTFSSDTKNRTEKHARHLLRLCMQGWHLYSTGELRIQVEDPDQVFAFGERVAAGDVDLAAKTIAEYEERFNQTSSVLPDEPDTARAPESARTGAALVAMPENDVERQQGLAGIQRLAAAVGEAIQKQQPPLRDWHDAVAELLSWCFDQIRYAETGRAAEAADTARLGICLIAHIWHTPDQVDDMFAGEDPGNAGG